MCKTVLYRFLIITLFGKQGLVKSIIIDMCTIIKIQASKNDRFDNRNKDFIS